MLRAGEGLCTGMPESLYLERVAGWGHLEPGEGQGGHAEDA